MFPSNGFQWDMNMLINMALDSAHTCHANTNTDSPQIHKVASLATKSQYFTNLKAMDIRGLRVVATKVPKNLLLQTSAGRT